MYVLLSPVTGLHDLGSTGSRLLGNAYDGAGSSVAGVGDMDGDGWSDVLVGAPEVLYDAGAAYLVLSPGL